MLAQEVILKHFEVFSLIGYLFDKVYNQKFKEEGINTILEYDKELQITHNRKFLRIYLRI